MGLKKTSKLLTGKRLNYRVRDGVKEDAIAPD